MFYVSRTALEQLTVNTWGPSYASQVREFQWIQGIPTQNVLASYDFNLCFTFVLPGTTSSMHNSHILANMIHNSDINFSIPNLGKYYLVDSRLRTDWVIWLLIMVSIFDTISRSSIRCQKEDVEDFTMHENDSISVTRHVGISLRGRLEYWNNNEKILIVCKQWLLLRQWHCIIFWDTTVKLTKPFVEWNRKVMRK